MAKAKKPKHIAVAGNIGAGKTTLTEMLSKHYKWIPQFEDVVLPAPIFPATAICFGFLVLAIILTLILRKKTPAHH